MKYLKTFERFESYSSFYHEIPVEEYEEHLFMDDFPKDWQRFTEEEINGIKSAVMDIYGEESVDDVIDFNRDIRLMIRLGHDDLHAINPYHVYRITIESEDASEGEVHICKASDEWYFIERPPRWNGEEDDPIRFFKCDQFDGLVEFLKNEI